MIKQYFNDRCISIRQWAKKHGLNVRMTYAVLNGEVLGKYETKANSSKKVFEALLSEGIIDEMPTLIKNENERAS